MEHETLYVLLVPPVNLRSQVGKGRLDALRLGEIQRSGHLQTFEIYVLDLKFLIDGG
jgi:hypothetical protein